MECNLRNAMVSASQSGDRLENRRSEDNKMSERVW